MTNSQKASFRSKVHSPTQITFLDTPWISFCSQKPTRRYVSFTAHLSSLKLTPVCYPYLAFDDCQRFCLFFKDNSLQRAIKSKVILLEKDSKNTLNFSLVRASLCHWNWSLLGLKEVSVYIMPRNRTFRAFIFRF